MNEGIGYAMGNTIYKNFFNHTVNGKMCWQIIHDESRVEYHHAKKFASLCFGRFIEIARSQGALNYKQ